jgi:hypothetical protein
MKQTIHIIRMYSILMMSRRRLRVVLHVDASTRDKRIKQGGARRLSAGGVAIRRCGQHARSKQVRVVDVRSRHLISNGVILI